jgi:SIR2-like protein
MPGHVFVVKGDLRKLACDAWLMPCGGDARPDRSWIEETPAADVFDWPAPPPGWTTEDVRVLELTRWPESAPRPWLVNVGASTQREIAWFVEGARQFLDRASERLRGSAPRYDRAKHLLGLPLVGTGGGGARHAAGAVVHELLPALHAAAAAHDVDIALVTREEEAFAAAQAGRARTDEGSRWAALGPRRLGEADRIARLAASGNLVLFIGAGVAKGAGLPLLDELLEALATEARVSNDERRALAGLDPTDRARIIARRLDDQDLGDAVARLFSRFRHHSISHALLAALPVEAVVTTNWDVLFEEASAAAGVPVRTVPGHPDAEARRWVLKMHGSIDDPKRIVVTREDYLRYEDQRQALAGIVQALLITRHMLFVGFGLSDDNFHRIMDAVRKAHETDGDADVHHHRYGTALVLLQNRLQQELWEPDLHWIAMADAERGPDAESVMREAVRRLEIFLDCVGSRTASARYLLRPSYRGMLTRPEQALADALRHFVENLDDEARRAPQWEHVKVLLTSLGWDPDDRGSFR